MSVGQNMILRRRRRIGSGIDSTNASFYFAVPSQLVEIAGLIGEWIEAEVQTVEGAFVDVTTMGSGAGDFSGDGSICGAVAPVPHFPPGLLGA